MIYPRCQYLFVLPMTQKHEEREQPTVGVGGVVIFGDRVVLIRRGTEPLKGRWSIPGGRLEWGETLAEGVRRELREETGLEVRVGELIEAFERMFRARCGRPRYHFIILDFLCEARPGRLQPGGDVTGVALAREGELARYHLTGAATRVIRKAFRMARRRRGPAASSPRRSKLPR
jgi:8-oxo-dGTP diphosphatase